MRQTETEKRKAELKSPAEEEPEFQIAPMIDILLVLLVFFMSISSTEVLQTNKSIILPVAKDAKDKDQTNPSQVIVNVTWLTAGAIEVDEKLFPDPVSILPALRKKIEQNPTTRVLLRADKEVRYEYLRAVLKTIGDAGVTNVTFSVVDKETQMQGSGA